MKDNRRTQVWVYRETRNELKARASKEGLSLTEYMAKLAKMGKEEEESLKKYKGGFF